MNDWAGVLTLVGTQLATSFWIFTSLSSRINRLEDKFDRKFDDMMKLYIDHLEKHHAG